MIKFILNKDNVETALSEGSTILDFVRYQKRLTGTKIGCREGDCGACTILVGDLENDKLVYRSITSCLMPIINAQGKHIVTIEGINMKGLSPVQQALVDSNGTQCGFCTIGFVMSLTGFVMGNRSKRYEDAIAAIDGNICRCTGYKSIERAAHEIILQITDKSESETVSWLVEHKFIPDYFGRIHDRLRKLKNLHLTTEIDVGDTGNKMIVGGGSDLVVQKPWVVKKSLINAVFDNPLLKEIKIENGVCSVGASVTVTAFSESPVIQRLFPDLRDYIKLISSTPIRNMATMGGNIVNASPIGDMSIFFLALDSELILSQNDKTRAVKLRNFYKSYKTIDKEPGEIVESIVFKIPGKGSVFNFEKVCKRTWLDIASVNSACSIRLNASGIIEEVHLSAGGVAPFPKYLFETVSFLSGRRIETEVMLQAIKIMYKEIAPISDARGTTEYKKLLLRQLFLGHLIRVVGINDEIRNAIKKNNELK